MERSLKVVCIWTVCKVWDSYCPTWILPPPKKQKKNKKKAVWKSDERLNIKRVRYFICACVSYRSFEINKPSQQLTSHGNNTFFVAQLGMFLLILCLSLMTSWQIPWFFAHCKILNSLTCIMSQLHLHIRISDLVRAMQRIFDIEWDVALTGSTWCLLEGYHTPRNSHLILVIATWTP